MQWQALIAIPLDECFEDGLKAKIEKVNSRIGQALENRQLHDLRLYEARNELPEDLDFDSLIACDIHRASRMHNLQDEVRLRRDIAALEGEVTASLAAASDVAWKESERADRDVRKMLVKAGYVNTEAWTETEGSITPNMVFRHPMPTAYRRRAESLRWRISSRVFWTMNEESLGKVQAEIERERDRVVSKG
jgi:hypothetical protein